LPSSVVKNGEMESLGLVKTKSSYGRKGSDLQT